jgi:hypothetical protein
MVYAALRNKPPAEAEDLLAAFLAKYPADGVARYHRGLPGMAVIPAAHLN